MTTYVYSKTPGIIAQIESSLGVAPTALGLTQDGDIRNVFASPLDTDLQGILDDFWLNRGYSRNPKTIIFHASSKMVDNAIPIVEVATWQVLGGVCSDPRFFVPDLSRVLGRIVASVQALGTGAELQLVENDGSTDVVIASLALPDTTSLWSIQKFNTTVTPRAGDMTYRLEGRLNAATLAAIRFTSLTLLELL